MLKKNDIITVQIESVNIDGYGIARHEGVVVFVAQGVTGDSLEVLIIKAAKRYYIAKIKTILTPSPLRITPDCAFYPRCGGCNFRHITYEGELAIKQQHVEDAIKRIGGLDIPIATIFPSPETYHYRNKAQLPVQSDGKILRAGFYAANSHQIVTSTDCLLQDEAFAPIADYTLELLNSRGITAYDEQSGKGILRHIFLRRGKGTGEIQLGLIINAPSLPSESELAADIAAEFPAIKSVCVSVNAHRANAIMGSEHRTIYGKRTIRDCIGGVQFDISMPSFYQVNPRQTERLYAIAKQLADICEGEVVADLYCGIGTIGLYVTSDHPASNLIGVEVVDQAIIDAKANAKLNGAANTRFIAGDASEVFAKLADESVKPSVVLIDPPRKGCSPELVELLALSASERIVYISCDPATLARDLRLFAERGYHTDEVRPVDMFARTGNVECVCVLRQNP